MFVDSNDAEEDFFYEVTSTDFSEGNKTCNESVKRRTVVGPWKNV